MAYKGKCPKCQNDSCWEYPWKSDQVPGVRHLHCSVCGHDFYRRADKKSIKTENNQTILEFGNTHKENQSDPESLTIDEIITILNHHRHIDGFDTDEELEN